MNSWKRFLTVLVFVLLCAGAAHAAECNDAADNDGDGGIDTLNQWVPNNTQSQTYNTVSIRIAVNNHSGTNFVGGQDMRNNAASYNYFCKMLGYAKATVISTLSYDSCGDNQVFYWNGSRWLLQPACDFNSFVQNIRCHDRIPFCRDGKDNDRDGKIDYPADEGCATANDTSEAPHDPTCTTSGGLTEFEKCNNAKDDDADGKIDAADPGCWKTPGDPTSYDKLDDDEANPPQCADGLDNDSDGATDIADFSCSGPTDTDEGNPKAQCQDGSDNDADGKTDFPTDPGCASAQDNDEFNALPQCADGIDNDGDGATDSADFSCGDPTDTDEGNPKAQCQDGADNDGDGKVDFLTDPGCASAQDNDEFNALPQCADGIDNDGDGATDLNDFSCSGPTDDNETSPKSQCQDGVDNDADAKTDYPTDPGCSTAQDNDEFNTNPQCSDGIDNDGDGATDTADYSCSGPTDTDETNPKSQCQDGADNDGDSRIDYPSDPGCTSSQDNNEFNTSPQCSDGLDNDGDGAVDTADFSCSGPTDTDETNPKSQCQDGADNDGDSKIDYPSDPGCTSSQDNSEFNTNPQCSDGIDNDGDGAVDTADFSCSGPTDTDESNPKSQCQDGIDNDGDGKVDLNDPGCSSRQDNDEFNTNPQCSDGIDNDGDGAVDTADFSCSGPTDTDESNPKSQCQDGIDNDGDGKVDLNDPGCSSRQDNDEFNSNPQCSDGIDNDGDGAVDTADFSCSGPTDTDESNPKSQCQDGIDNDGDGKVDLNDPGCSSRQDNDEFNTNPQCSDGIDNDGDGKTDYPSDQSCSGPNDGDETNPIAAPANLKASDGTSQDYVQVTWSSVIGATSYQVYRSQFAGTIGAPVGSPVGVTSLFDETAVPGVTYYYTAIGKNSAGDGPASNTDSGFRATPPSACQDSDADGSPDADEIVNGTDKNDPGSFMVKLNSLPEGAGVDPSQCVPSDTAAYTKYNTYLSQLNFLELVASGTQSINNLKVSAYNLSGEVINSVSMTIAAGQQFDVDVLTLIGGQKDRYGIIKINFDSRVSGATLLGRMTHYRPNPNGIDYSFAFARELRNSTRGDTYATGNSFDPQGAGYLVPNWGEIVNVSDTPQTFVANLYSQTGTLLYTRTVTVPMFGEVDIQAGHEYGENVYLFEVKPQNGNAKYFMNVSRYSSNSYSGSESPTYNYAFSLEGRAGSGAPQFAPIANRVGGCYTQTNWAEVVNVREKPVTARVTFRTSAGAEIAVTDLPLAPKSQYHLNASALLPKGGDGSIKIESSDIGALVTQSLVYFHDCSSNQLQTGFAVQGRMAGRDVMSGTVNSFLGMKNELFVASATQNTISATLTIAPFGSTPLPARVLTIGGGAQALDVLNAAGSGFPANSYGVVRLDTNRQPHLIAPFIFRSRELADGRVDFIFPTLVQ